MSATIEAFRQAMSNAGIEPLGEIIADSTLHRHTPAGDKPHTNNSWYVLHDNEPAAGAFGCWKRQINETWTAKAYQSMNPTEKAAYTAKMEAMKQQREAERQQIQAGCRKWCADTWGKAEDATDDHPYLKLKGIPSYGLKSYKDTLIVPVEDMAGTIHGLQFIAPDGTKKFKTGSEKTGHFHAIGRIEGNTLLIAEGYATASSVHQATGYPVLVAFDAGNLRPVTEAVKSKCPHLKIIICADDDHATEGNPGITKATEAARAVGGLVAVPVFPSDRGPKDTDFNDLHRLAGLDAVRLQIGAAIEIDQGKEQQPVDRPSLFISAREFLRAAPSVSYLIDRMIEEDTTGQVFGPSGGGKTFVVLDWALSTATGHNVNSRKVKQGLVLYLAGEGHNGLRRRVKAWQIHHGLTVDDLRFFHLSRHTIAFDGSGLDDVVAEAQTLAEAHEVPVSLIVVDTLARHLEGDENNTRDMGKFIAAVDSLRAPLTGCVALIVHHSGHGEETRTRGRGSSALKAAMDFEIRCDKGLLTFTKMKDGEQPEPIPFKLRPLPLEESKDGEPVTSCIVEYGKRAEHHQEAEMTSMERLAVKALAQASANTQMEADGKPAALITDWRETFYALRREKDPEVKDNTVKNAFLRAVEGLLLKKMVTEEGHLRILSKGAVPSQPSHVTDRHNSSQVTGEVERHTSHTLYIGCDHVTASCDAAPNFNF